MKSLERFPPASHCTSRRSAIPTAEERERARAWLRRSLAWEHQLDTLRHPAPPAVAKVVTRAA